MDTEKFKDQRLKDFGEIMNKICKERQISLNKIAKDCSIDRMYLTAIRHGRRNSKFDTFLKIMNYLKISNYRDRDHFFKSVSKKTTADIISINTKLQKSLVVEYINGEKNISFLTACDIAEVVGIDIINYENI